MSVEAIDIRIREDGARVVQRNISGIGSSADAASRQVYLLERTLRTLRNAAYAVGSVLFLRELKQYADQWIGIQNSVRLSTRSTEEATAVQEGLFAASQRTRQSMEGMVALYRRMAQSQGALGASQQQMIDFTEGVGMSLVVQGTSAQAASGALLQLGQLLGMARIRAQEFNSINENAPRILQAVADNMDGAGGSIQNLRQMIFKGEVSGREFFDAFMQGLPKLRAEFEKTRPTIGQAFTVLDNAIGRYVGKTDEAVGASTMIARSIVTVANNVDTLAASFAILGAGAAVAVWPLISAGIAKAIVGLKALWAAMLANPILAIAALLAAAITALVMFRDEIMVVSDLGISLGDYMRATWDTIVEGITKASQWVTDLFAPALTYLQNVVKENGLQWGDLFELIKKGFNVMIGMVIYVVKTIVAYFKGLIPAFNDIFFQAINGALKAVQDGLNWIIKAINEFAESAHIPFWEDIGLLDLGQFKNDFEGKAKELGDTVGQAFVEGMTTDYIGNAFGAVGNMFDGLTAKAHIYAQARRDAEEHKAGAADLTLPPDKIAPTDTDAAGRAAKKLKTDLESLYSKLDPIRAAMMEVAEAENLLNRAHAEGLIPLAERNRLLSLLWTYYQDALNPLAALNREMDKEKDLLKLTGKARDDATEFQRTEQALKEKGIVLNAFEADALRNQIKLMREANEVASARNQIYQDVHGPLENLATSQKALNEMFADGLINLQQYNTELAKFRLEAGQGTFTDGFLNDLGILDAAMYNFTAKAGSEFAAMTQTMTDGLADATAQAIVYGDSWRDAVGTAANQAIAGLISGLIKVGIQMMLNKVLGEALSKAALASTVGTATATAAAWAPAASLASLASFGSNSGPAMAALTATTALAKTLALSSSIGGFKTGGEFTVGGAGGPDSQLVAFRATPGENVRINTPAQEKASTQPTQVNVPIKVVNVTDPSVALSAMSSSEGEQIILNVIRNNPNTVRSAVGTVG